MLITVVFTTGLEKRPSNDEEDGREAIWNGDEFIFLGSDWGTMLKLFWRYGYHLLSLKKYL